MAHVRRGTSKRGTWVARLCSSLPSSRLDAHSPLGQRTASRYKRASWRIHNGSREASRSEARRMARHRWRPGGPHGSGSISRPASPRPSLRPSHLSTCLSPTAWPTLKSMILAAAPLTILPNTQQVISVTSRSAGAYKRQRAVSRRPARPDRRPRQGDAVAFDDTLAAIAIIHAARHACDWFSPKALACLY